MKTTTYNIIDSLKYAFGDEKWKLIVEETWRVHDETWVQRKKMNSVLEKSELFNNMPYCTACLIIECFRENFYKDDPHVYGFGNKR